MGKIKRLWLKIWPSSLTGQMVAVVLMALFLALLVSIMIFGGAYQEAVRSMNQGALVKRTATLVELLESTPQELHRSILKASNARYERVRIERWSEVKNEYPEKIEEKRLYAALLRELGPEYKDRARVKAERKEMDNSERYKREWDRGDWDRKDRMKQHHRDKWRPQYLSYLEVSIQLNSGLWLTMKAFAPNMPTMILKQTVLFLVASIVCVLLAVVLMLRRITRPMRQLASASHRLGVGENVEPLAEEGPSDIRETVQAFNLMNERMQRFVSDRTRMLAALSHDLRTPITTMRLRVEMMDECEDRDQMLATLDEMQQMSEATLDFMRQSSDSEKSRTVELNALLSSLCEDMVDLGHPVEFAESEETIIHCRLVSLKRALRNLIENGIKYGQQVSVSLCVEQDIALISIQDSGPGIPENRMEKVFEPFIRLEESRNRDTGGIGLGLSIARNVVRNHGGDIELENNEQGLRVSVSLPLQRAG